jgi:hypothetical protein
MNADGKELDQEIAENIFSGQLDTLITISIDRKNKNKHFFGILRKIKSNCRHIYNIDQF